MPRRSRKLDREELERRIEADDGAEDDTVYTQEVNGGVPKAGFIYHDDPDCQHLNGGPIEFTRHGAQLRWKAPCKVCVLDEGKA